LVLDEPNTHLDLPSLHVLEPMLGQFRGAMRVVAHDQAFIERLQPTGNLRL
jgi:ATPase subunit of ABC transporter with duplicated ATPase domains